MGEKTLRVKRCRWCASCLYLHRYRCCYIRRQERGRTWQRQTVVGQTDPPTAGPGSAPTANMAVIVETVEESIPVRGYAAHEMQVAHQVSEYRVAARVAVEGIEAVDAHRVECVRKKSRSFMTSRTLPAGPCNSASRRGRSSIATFVASLSV